MVCSSNKDFLADEFKKRQLPYFFHLDGFNAKGNAMTDNITHLPILEIIKIAWKKVKGSKTSFLTIVIFSLLIQGAQTWLNTIENLTLLGMLLSLVLLIPQFILLWGIIYLGAERAADISIHYIMIKHVISVGLFFKMMGYYLLQMLALLLPIVILGIPVLLSFVIPVSIHTASIVTTLSYVIALGLAIFLLMRLYIAPIIIITQGIGPWKAIKMSFNATRSNVCRLTVLVAINSFILAISIIPFGIGLIWTIPYLSINYGVVYRKLIWKM
jgi:hypothetical protein